MGTVHLWYSGAPGNKFVLASVVKKPARQTDKDCHTANIDALLGRMSCSWCVRVGVHCFGHFQTPVPDVLVSWTGQQVCPLLVKLIITGFFSYLVSHPRQLFEIIHGFA